MTVNFLFYGLRVFKSTVFEKKKMWFNMEIIASSSVWNYGIDGDANVSVRSI